VDTPGECVLRIVTKTVFASPTDQNASPPASGPSPASGQYLDPGASGSEDDGWEFDEYLTEYLTESISFTESPERGNPRPSMAPYPSEKPYPHYNNGSYPSGNMTRMPSSISPSSARSSASPSSTCVNSPTNRQCWGQYDINTNYYDVIPDTGHTAEYWFTISNVTMAPDGVERMMLVVNNQYPGPVIEANWGDWIVVHVQNNLQNNGYYLMSSDIVPRYIGMGFIWI
jgi:hypothetical protein